MGDECRWLHASVVLDHPEKANVQMVVVLGGNKGANQGTTNSVLMLNLEETAESKQWQEGPPLCENRDSHAAVV